VGQQLTINEALITQKTLRARYSELVGLRDANTVNETRWHGANADKPVEKRVVYDALALDRSISVLARDLRTLDMALKRTNALTLVENYEYDEGVLGELEPAK
jgi:hypothetical protein